MGWSHLGHIKDNIIGPFFFDSSVTGDVYLNSEEKCVASSQSIDGGRDRSCLLPTHQHTTLKLLGDG